MQKSDRAGDDVKEGIVCLRCVGLVIAKVGNSFVKKKERNMDGPLHRVDIYLAQALHAKLALPDTAIVTH